VTEGNNKLGTPGWNFFANFFGERFSVLLEKMSGRRKNFATTHILLAVARPYVPDPVRRFAKKLNNSAALSRHFPQLAHYVESRRGIARECYLIRWGRNQTAKR
jgi:hypothetical protein